uniref:Uncharacterized protein n=1 Tax=Oryza rufipogon TaxID=4529 RepID=A0A0E0QVD7_ORYRU
MVENSTPHTAHSWTCALSFSAAAAAGSLSSFACSRVWLVMYPPSAWNDGNLLLHVLHSNTNSAARRQRGPSASTTTSVLSARVTTA